MNKYLDKSILCDTRRCDGSVFFRKEYFEFVARLETEKFNFKINYLDIVDIIVHNGIKKRVRIVTDTQKYDLYLYKVATLKEAIQMGIADSRVIVNESSPKSPLTNDDIEKLSKLNELHKEGVIDDERYNFEKEQILNK